MEQPVHSLHDLFAQLGLPSTHNEIEGFIASHQGLNARTQLADAPFWSRSQAAFLREGLRDDSDWAECIDELNVRLR
ncbi:DUF2789 domain-containing protein [Gallaecimonas xiamenensis]|uniref:DUF2789 domain-containing protein n=1 Tax=Gallaecimonas xiamenensis 3-C-1 TaxID=745411 RepID=K2JFV8_9GAMM|nr:DUF2789 domain-containing protein [Gallaecimonas xiamenensis]EKE74053.1 hypothetical protein B3C1_09548 [Gallaecimonas xiamenensis 3-C-1]